MHEKNNTELLKKLRKQLPSMLDLIVEGQHQHSIYFEQFTAQRKSGEKSTMKYYTTQFFIYIRQTSPGSRKLQFVVQLSTYMKIMYTLVLCQRQRLLLSAAVENKNIKAG